MSGWDEDLEDLDVYGTVTEGGIPLQGCVVELWSDWVMPDEPPSPTLSETTETSKQGRYSFWKDSGSGWFHLCLDYSLVFKINDEVVARVELPYCRGQFVVDYDTVTGVSGP
jgi:hypothetical protein